MGSDTVRSDMFVPVAFVPGSNAEVDPSPLYDVEDVDDLELDFADMLQVV